jgi:uncharacterized membrane protein
MPTIVHWLHVVAAVILLGGLGFLLLVLIPASSVLNPEQSEALAKAVEARFRWINWSAMVLLLLTGLYAIRRYYWEEPWDRAWKVLTFKIVLAFVVFAVLLGLTVPLPWFESLRARHRIWLLVAFTVGTVVVLISAYLRRG